MRAGGRNEAELVGDGCTGALLTPGEGRRGFPPGEGEAAVGCTGALPTLGEGRRWISRGEAGLTARALALPPCYVNQVNECSGRGPPGHPREGRPDASIATTLESTRVSGGSR